MFFELNYYIKRMSKSKEIQEQYLSLRYKVEGKIKQLQSKLSPSMSPNSKLITSNINSPNHYSHHRCHNNCHHHHCHPPTPPGPCNSISNIDMIQSECQTNQQRGNQSKNDSVNELISEALAESLKNQKQINEHIRAINQKIETLSAQHNRSNLSDAFSESVSKNARRPVIHENFFRQEQKIRCRSEMKNQERGVAKHTDQHTPQKITVKRVKNKIKGSENSSSNILKGKKNQNKKVSVSKSKSKSGSKFRSQYFLSFGCPVHSPNKISLKSIQMKQIYKDSEYRNRKHQKNHLIESFRQQEQSRKRLISKIANNVFNQYGKK